MGFKYTTLELGVTLSQLFTLDYSLQLQHSRDGSPFLIITITSSQYCLSNRRRTGESENRREREDRRRYSTVSDFRDQSKTVVRELERTEVLTLGLLEDMKYYLMRQT